MHCLQHITHLSVYRVNAKKHPLRANRVVISAVSVIFCMKFVLLSNIICTLPPNINIRYQQNVAWRILFILTLCSIFTTEAQLPVIDYVLSIVACYTCGWTWCLWLTKCWRSVYISVCRWMRYLSSGMLNFTH